MVAAVTHPEYMLKPPLITIISSNPRGSFKDITRIWQQVPRRQKIIMVPKIIDHNLFCKNTISQKALKIMFAKYQYPILLKIKSSFLPVIIEEGIA